MPIAESSMKNITLSQEDVDLCPSLQGGLRHFPSAFGDLEFYLSSQRTVWHLIYGYGATETS